MLQLPPFLLQFERRARPTAPDPNNWQTVVHGIAYVYSAFLDSTSKGQQSSIRILGTLHRDELTRVLLPNETNHYICRVWFASGTTRGIDKLSVDVNLIRLIASINE